MLGSSLAIDPSRGLCAFPPAGDWQTGFRLFSRPYRDSFHLSLGVLVRYRTPHVFRLGRFALPYSDGNSSPPYSVSGHRHVFAYGAVTLFGCLFQGNSARHATAWCRRHMSPRFRVGIRLGLHPFRSPLLRASPLLSLPAPTMMLRFRAFPSRAPVRPADGLPPGQSPFGWSSAPARIPGTPRGYRGTKSHSEIPGSEVACAFPGHIAACRVLRRRRSRVIHLPAYAYRTNRLPE